MPAPSNAGDPAARALAASCRALTVRYRLRTTSVLALDRVDAEFPQGRISAICGASGSGKSSLIGALCGMVTPESGVIIVGGQNVSDLKRRGWRRLRRASIGIVLQSPRANLIEQLRASEQVAFAARLRGAGSHEVDRVLEAVGIGHVRSSRPHQLSGGEQQRVAIAAAAVGRPALLVADEPTAQLDGDTAQGVIALLKQLSRDGTTIIISTHDKTLVSAADRVLYLRDGRVDDA